MGVNAVKFQKDGRLTVPLSALSEDALEQLAKQPEKLPEETLRQLSTHPRIRFQIARNPKTPASMLALMVKEFCDDIENVGKELAKNPVDFVRDSLAERRREDFELLKKIAKNPASSREIIRELMSFPELHLSIANNHDAPKEFLNEIYESCGKWWKKPYSFNDLITRLAANPHSSDQLLEDILGKVDFDESHLEAFPEDQALKKRVENRIARNLGTPTRLLCKITNYCGDDHTMSLAILNPNRSAEMLQRIYNKENPDTPVLALIAMCPETPTEILTELSEHENPTIRRVASETLKNKQSQ